MSSETLLSNYPAPDTRFDELFAEPGLARPHWRPLLEHLTSLGASGIDARHREVTRMLRENGVTYNVYADPQGPTRPWDLDLLPLLVSDEEWDKIEAAVTQRATLLNRILGDIYGGQALIREGRLPAALVHGHSGFLRPCYDLASNRQTALQIYAADLARSPDGQWWVLRDRTQGPTGAGYALENRLAITRAFPDLFRNLNVQRLAGFMATLRDSLAARAPRTDASEAVRHLGHEALADSPDDPPLIVLLTAGPYSETYSEQAFLARYLGYPLVVGGDLTVRQGFVWLKTLSGLHRVSVIVRRLDDDYCDPLELRADSSLGVPGLTEAARRGNVVVANGLGSGVLESGSMLGYLPGLCTELLGESLLMPSVATWWCGEPAALEDAIARLDDLVVKPAFPGIGVRQVFGQDLDGQARADLIARMRARPQNYLAQEQVELSRAPTWRSPSALGAAAVGLRVFACATRDGRYAVMPGGLARVASRGDARVISMQEGGGSKDTWVLSSRWVSQISLLSIEETAAHPTRGEGRQASRTVENLYWFGRYSERVDNFVRLLRRTFDTMLGASPDQRGADWRTLVELCRWAELIDAPAPREEGAAGAAAEGATAGEAGAVAGASVTPPTAEAASATGRAARGEPVDDHNDQIQARLLAAVFSDRPSALPAQIQLLYDVSSRLHERLSVDNWRVLNQMVQRLGSVRKEATVDAAVQRLDETVVTMMTLSGFALDGMTRDLGWRFLSLGRRIERFLYMTTVLSKALVQQRPGESLEWLLEIGDSIATYRSRYVTSARWPLVLDLLLTDETNPRSVAFQLGGMVSAAHKLGALDKGRSLALLDPLLRDLQDLRGSTGLHRDSQALIAWLDRATATGYRLSDELCGRYFSYSATGSPRAGDVERTAA